MLATTLIAAVLALGPASAVAAPVAVSSALHPLYWRTGRAAADNVTAVPASTLSQLLKQVTTSTNATGAAPADGGGFLDNVAHKIGSFVAGSDNSTANTVELSNDTITSTFVRTALFTQVSYCSANAVLSWKCGPPCDALPNVKPLQAGGNDAQVPGYYIAHDPDADQIVVAHQGTNARSVISIANDAQFAQVALNRTLFPVQWSNDTKVHEGFQKTQGRTADGVLSGVKAALASTGCKNVLVAGHSLGAAIAVMDAMMLHQNLPSEVNINTVVFGLPRGGNQNWATLVDKTLGPQFAHVSNQHDPVPVVPPQFLSYVHPQGEVHIAASTPDGTPESVVNCPGTENQNCSDGHDLIDTDVSNHLGPYFRSDIFMSGAGCPL